MPYRRMTSNQITLTDKFRTMPGLTRLVYRTLFDYADDDGFVSSPLMVARDCETDKSAIDTLVEKEYLIRFDSGVVLIRHWFIHNYIRKDRYTETLYSKERNQVFVGKDKVYRLLSEVEDPGTLFLEEPSLEETEEDIEYPEEEELPEDREDPEEECAAEDTGASDEKEQAEEMEQPTPAEQPEVPAGKSEEIHIEVQPPVLRPTIEHNLKAILQENRYVLDTLKLGSKGWLWISENLFELIKQTFPTSWQQKLEELTQYRSRTRKKSGYGLRGPLSNTELAMLFGPLAL